MTVEKTVDEVYTDRNLLAVAMVHMAVLEDYAGGWYEPDADDADADEWAIVWARLPTGQVSWHVPRDLARRSALPQTSRVWDGHGRDEKNTRLRTFAEAGS
ncbi:hypothetical protein [Natrinema longum]|uniref:WDGH domain-containing protein n=1 Tax=Natrinema longum TaxID=370324 RepID=A0A8A2UBQ1_9EURY|nr:hypothetical protein [Natrinema longum]MBZ6496008.1 hypothetical protein [Natrinema longum]QSW86060.1 hypothetical protein J0X27_04300 [Natrinema longum]